MVILGVTTLLIAANKKQKQHLCNGINITIQGIDDKIYIQKDEVLKQVEHILGSNVVHMPVSLINISFIENVLKQNPWIKNAEIYFDAKDAMHVNINEREPIARVFTNEGSTFYIDSSGMRMPLLYNSPIRLVAITGFTNAKILNGHDSLILNEIKNVAYFIHSHTFWNEQIGQIDILSDNNIQLIPVIGNQIIQIGDGANIDNKLNKLYIFYNQVLNRVGLNKYNAIDLRFDGQVIATKNKQISTIDSLQLIKNIQELMNKTSLNDSSEEIHRQDIEPLTIKDSIQNDEAVKTSLPVKTLPVQPKKLSSHPLKTSISQNENHNKSKKKIKPKLRLPKAVMKNINSSRQ